jgi:transposase InsO family protein
MTVTRMCQLGHVSRAGLYRFDPEGEGADDDLDLRNEIQRIALEFPCYGRPRITAELKRRGWKVNHKRVARIMREDNLLCLRRRKFVVTTDSSHGFHIYPNLAGSMELTGINQLWISDITYIRLEKEFVYLAVVLDAYSRRVIGWALDRTLEDDLAIAALNMAFRRRSPAEGLTHHSDRGVQYASNDYTNLLKDRGVRISMSRKGNPYDNAFCESFMKTLKYEEVYRQEYRDLTDAQASIERFI